MKINEKKYDVLIVGCGPSGATLANLLRMRGRSVAIFDRDKEVFYAPRAMALDAQSCRIYQNIGVLNRMIPDDAAPFYQHRMVDENRKMLLDADMSIAPRTEGHPGMGMYFYQPSLETMLREDFNKGVGVDAFLGYEVTAVDGSGDVATLTAIERDTGETIQFQGAYIVGADGGKSLCRKAIPNKRVDLNYKRKWIVMDLIMKDQATFDALREGSEFRCIPNGSIVFVKGLRNHIRFDFEAGERADSFTEEDARKMIAEYFDTTDYDIIRRTPYYFYAGMPDNWRHNRLLIAGDAAHQTSPFAGQGLNMGIRDANNLAWKLHLVQEGIASDKLLDSYMEEHWELYARIINHASKTGQALSTDSKLKMFLRNLTYKILDINQAFFLKKSIEKSALKDGYTNGIIGQGKIAGARFPQFEIKTKDGTASLFDELTGNEFYVIKMDSSTGNDLDWFTTTLKGKIIQLGKDFTDSDNQYTNWFKKHKVKAVLVRPDKYIYDGSNDANQLCSSLKQKLSSYV